MEKIEIKDFLGIKDITIEVKEINIFIGSQASGKSVIAKLIYYFKNLISILYSAAVDDKDIGQFDQDCLIKFRTIFPSLSWGSKSFTIKYSLNNEFIEINRLKENTDETLLNYSEFYRDNFEDLKVTLSEHKNQQISESYKSRLITKLQSDTRLLTAFLMDIANEINNKSISFDQLYIPAGRSFFSSLQSNVFSLLSENIAIDLFLVFFGNRYEHMKTINEEILPRKLKHKDTKLLKELNLLIDKILCGKHIQINDEDYIQDDNRIVSISNSSSGQQETLPLSIIMRILAFEYFEEIGTSVYIEEPEAHIFPTAQRNIVELMATVYNARRDNLQFFITTHSPYILTSFNNLLQAGMLAVDADEEKIKAVEKFVPRSRFIQPEEIAVYSVEGGYCKSIMDEETGLIDANIIDEVSNKLAVQFDELLDLEE